MSTSSQAFELRLQDELGKAVVGLEGVIRALAIAVIARGHVLLQGPPGLGKTLLSKSLAAALGGVFKRVQGTADLMPADITGVHVFDASKSEFVFRPGPVFADVLLVDEINRTGPKTQSALLEAMEERHVTIDRQRHALPADFLVIATQNPREFEGTYPLPESQLDRFMMRIEMTYPAAADEHAILARFGKVETPAASIPVAALEAGRLAVVRGAADGLHVADELPAYVLALARASRENPHLSLGLSTRGAVALLRAARVCAVLRGADFVSPDDVKEMFPLIVPHRLVLGAEALLEGLTDRQVAQRVLEQVAVPR
jgi:MoxR-like ATPase